MTPRRGATKGWDRGAADVVKSAYEAFGKGDIPGVLDVVADDVDRSCPLTLPQGGHFVGKQQVVTFFEGLGAAWDGLALVIEAVGEIADGLVVGIARGAGSLRRGGKSGYGAAHVFNVADGKVTRFREYADVDAPLT